MKINLVPNKESLRRLREIGPQLEQTFAMDDPALLRALGQTHRQQEKEIFASEGATGARGSWAPLNARYAARKRKFVGNKKILNLTGDMKNRFAAASHPAYIQEYRPISAILGLFRFGARSELAAAHLAGVPLASKQSAIARRIFGGRAPRLPIRDMITKTATHLAELRETLRVWYIGKLRQSLRARARLGLR